MAFLGLSHKLIILIDTKENIYVLDMSTLQYCRNSKDG